MSETYLMLGMDRDGGAHVAIVLGNDLEASKIAFAKHFPGTKVISWPSLTDLRKSVAMMELAKENSRHPEILCAVLRA